MRSSPETKKGPLSPYLLGHIEKVNKGMQSIDIQKNADQEPDRPHQKLSVPSIIPNKGSMVASSPCMDYPTGKNGLLLKRQLSPPFSARV